MLQLQRTHGNLAVTKLLRSGPLAPVTTAIDSGIYLMQRDRLTTEIERIAGEELSRRRKRTMIVNRLNALDRDHRKRIASDPEFRRMLRRRLSSELFEELQGDLMGLAEGDAIIVASGGLTVTMGEPEPVVPAEPSDKARDLWLQLRDPGLARERAELLELTAGAKNLLFGLKLVRKLSEADTLARANLHLAIRQVEALDVALKLGDLASAEQLYSLTGATDLVKQGMKIVSGTASISSQTVYLAAKLTRNKALIREAGAMVKFAAKGIGQAAVLGDFFSSLHGLAKVIESDDPEERLEGAFELASGGAYTAGGIFKLLEYGAGKGTARAATWGTRAVKATAWGTAIEIEYLKLKLVAHLFNQARLGLAAPAVERKYKEMREIVVDLARASFELQHWFEAYGAALLGRSPEDEILEEEALVRLRRALPAVQEALRRLDESSKWMPRRMRNAFRSDKELTRAWALGTQSADGDPVLVASEALHAAHGCFSVADKLVLEYAEVLKEAADENADRFHGRER